MGRPCYLEISAMKKWTCGRNSGLRFPRVSTNPLRSWLLRKPTLASAGLLKALPLLTVRLLVKSYRVAD
jgi:hypothetical protein